MGWWCDATIINFMQKSSDQVRATFFVGVKVKRNGGR